MERTIKFSGDELRSWLQPCVYYLFDYEGNPLYIGYGKRGLRRVFSGHASEENRNKAFALCHKVEVSFFPDVRSAADSEIKEIRRLRPRFNTTGVAGRRKSAQGAPIAEANKMCGKGIHATVPENRIKLKNGDTRCKPCLDACRAARRLRIEQGLPSRLVNVKF